VEVIFRIQGSEPPELVSRGVVRLKEISDD
jgi:hypothetical protein